MNDVFVERGIGYVRILPGQTVSGFVFTELDEGTKRFIVRLLSVAGAKEFPFSIPIPGLRVDHHDKNLDCGSRPTGRSIATKPNCGGSWRLSRAARRIGAAAARAIRSISS